MPSECEDEVGWETLDPSPSARWSGINCTQVEELPEQWCSFLAPYVNLGKSTYEACCICGGGDHIPVAPSLPPSEVPSDAPTECVDEPGWLWNVPLGYGCESLSFSFCDDVDDIWYNGKNSYLACCVCGGGAHAPLAPSTSPSAVPSALPSSAPVTGSNAPPRRTEAPTLVPSGSPTCSVEGYLGQEYMFPYSNALGDNCYKVELFENGTFAMDVTNPGCGNGSFEDTVVISVFDFASGNRAHFKAGGDVGWTGEFVVKEDVSVGGGMDFNLVSMDFLSSSFEADLVFASCWQLSTPPTSAPSSVPSIMHSVLPSRGPSLVPSIGPSWLSNAPSVDVPLTVSTCAVEHFMGEEYIFWYGSGVARRCYRVELFDGGTFAIDGTNSGCSSGTFVETAVLSVFESASGSRAYFRAGDLGWAGEFVVKEDPSMVSDMAIGEVSIDPSSQSFGLELMFPRCMSAYPSAGPSVIVPSSAPTECVNEVDFYWDIPLSYGCTEMSVSFCENFSDQWYNGKNTMSACCVCGGGSHVPAAMMGT